MPALLPRRFSLSMLVYGPVYGLVAFVIAVMAFASLATMPLAAQDSAEGRAPAPDFSEEPAPGQTPQETPPEVKEVLDRMHEVIAALDGEANRNANNWQFTLDEQVMMVVTDTNAGRMRIITPIAETAALPEGAMERLMQANFDTALDARYAVGQGLVWGAFLHPLDSLTTRDFASGILQTKSLADMFGTTFSSGALNYGGGDSGALIDEQLKELLEELEKRETV
ncbi:MAG: hypothetical protein AAGL10_09065 [Pseudomonadota bacterium]